MRVKLQHLGPLGPHTEALRIDLVGDEVPALLSMLLTLERGELPLSAWHLIRELRQSCSSVMSISDDDLRQWRPRYGRPGP